MASNARYDDAQFYSRKNLLIEVSAGVSVPGTAANDTVLIRIPMTDSIAIDKIRMVAMTGGTADGPVVKIQKSLAGTGAASDIASQNTGTSADDTAFALTVTETDLDAGDHLLITNAAGTAASTPKVILNIGYKENFS